MSSKTNIEEKYKNNNNNYLVQKWQVKQRKKKEQIGLN